MPRSSWTPQLLWCWLGRQICWNYQKGMDRCLPQAWWWWSSHKLFQRAWRTCCIYVELDSGELPAQVKGLEHFVCLVYSSKGPTTLPSLRWELFWSKNLEGKTLPPTRATLLPHIMLKNFQVYKTSLCKGDESPTENSKNQSGAKSSCAKFQSGLTRRAILNRLLENGSSFWCMLCLSGMALLT